MWKCYYCGTTNWEKDPNCHSCSAVRKELREFIKEAKTSQQIDKIVDILEEWDSSVKKDMASAKDSLNRAKEIEKRNQNIIAEEKFLLNEIEKLKELRRPLKSKNRLIHAQRTWL